MQKYSVNQHLIDTVLAWVNSGEIIKTSMVHASPTSSFNTGHFLFLFFHLQTNFNPFIHRVLGIQTLHACFISIMTGQ